MTQSNFITYQRHRYFKWAVALGTICVLLYAFHTPDITPGGGTWLGYGLGTLGALLILMLLAFGLRKRAYRSDLGKLRGWLSAHVYFGIVLALVATLHTGFEFGLNIHTLAYVLTMGVIISGLWGVGLYLRQPTLMGNLLDGRTLQDLGQDLRGFDDQCRVVAKDHPHLMKMIEESASGAIFSSAWGRLTASNRRCATAKVLAQLAREGTQHLDDKAHRAQAEIQTLQFRRIQKLKRIREFVRLRTWTELWLLIHVPMSLALLMALIAHIVAVFFYW